MKVKVIGNNVTIISDIMFDDIVKLEQRNPDALVFKGDDGEAIFRISTTNPTMESINKFGVAFASKNVEGKAVISVNVDRNDDEELTKETIIKLFGTAIDNLSVMEQLINDASVIIDANDAIIEEMIEFE